MIDPEKRELAADGLPHLGRLQRWSAQSGADGYGFDHEFQLSIVETRTGVCDNLDGIRRELGLLRGALADAALESGLSVAAAGTMPTGTWRDIRTTPKPRYGRIEDLYREVVRRRATCGCHVHVGIPDRDLAVKVLGRVIPWLPVLLALSASSPFYEDSDTGFQSFRNLLWGAFPVSGTPIIGDSYADYRERVQLLIAAGVVLDPGSVYWDVRLGTNYQTLEFRVADACTTVDETVLQAGLCRALVLTCLQEVAHDQQPPQLLPELMRAATWQAARFGLDGQLIDVRAATVVPAAELLDRLLRYLRDALEQLGDWEEVLALTEWIRCRGNSASRQRGTLSRAGRLQDVVDQLIVESGVPAA